MRKRQRKRKTHWRDIFTFPFVFLLLFFLSLFPSNNAEHFSNSLNVYRISLIPIIPSIQISLIGEVSYSIPFELFERYDRSNISNSNRRPRMRRKELAAVASRTLNERSAPAKKLCYSSLNLSPHADPQLSLPLAVFQGAVVNIHEPRAPVAVVLPVVTRRPVARKFVRELPGRPCEARARGNGISIEFSKREWAREGGNFSAGIETHVNPDDASENVPRANRRHES